MKNLHSALLVIPVFLLSLGCASDSSARSALEVPIGKFIRLRGDDPNFSTSLRLPCIKGCTAVRDPQTWSQAAQHVGGGLNHAVRVAASEVLHQACQEVASCSPRSDEVWDRFYEMSQHVQIEENHSLDEYVSGVRTALVRVWGIDEICVSGAIICMSLKREVVGTPEMLVETIIRASLWKNEFGIQPSFGEIVVSMGDMLEEKRSNGPERELKGSGSFTDDP